MTEKDHSNQKECEGYDSSQGISSFYAEYFQLKARFKQVLQHSHAIALSIMHTNKCNLTVLLHLYQISKEQKSVRNASTWTVCKITDENVLLFSSQTIIPFNTDNHVISSCGRKTCLHTCVPISYVETQMLFYNILHAQTVIFQTYWNTFHEIAKTERCFWYQRVKSRAGAGNAEPGAEWLLNAWTAEGKLLTRHSTHIDSAGHCHTNMFFY